MEKKLWSQPCAVAQEFTANEYVAACWTVQCVLPVENWYETTSSGVKHGHDPEPTYTYYGKNKRENNYHSSDACGSLASQVLRDGVLYEISSIHGALECTITSGDPSVGGTIYWTNAADGKEWHHQGTVIYDERPNHS